MLFSTILQKCGAVQKTINTRRRFADYLISPGHSPRGLQVKPEIRPDIE